MLFMEAHNPTLALLGVQGHMRRMMLRISQPRMQFRTKTAQKRNLDSTSHIRNKAGDVPATLGAQWRDEFNAFPGQI